jgi:hypothetical protein
MASPAVLGSEDAQKAWIGRISAYLMHGGPPMARLNACRGRTSPVHSFARGARDWRSGRRQRFAFYPAAQGAAGGKLPDGKTTFGSPARGSISESRDEVLVALVEIQTHLPARRMEERRGRLLQPFGGRLRFLRQDGGRTFRGKAAQLALVRGLAFDLLDHLRDAPPVLLGREVSPAGKGLEVQAIRRREVQAFEGDASAPSEVLSGAVEPEPFESLLAQEGADGGDAWPGSQLLGARHLSATGEKRGSRRFEVCHRMAATD